jgi:hypothetical protein
MLTVLTVRPPFSLHPTGSRVRSRASPFDRPRAGAARHGATTIEAKPPLTRSCLQRYPPGRSSWATTIVGALDLGRSDSNFDPCRSGHRVKFVSCDLDLWAYQRGVTLDFSRPGKPTDNAFIESLTASSGPTQCSAGAMESAIRNPRLRRQGIFQSCFGSD